MEIPTPQDAPSKAACRPSLVAQSSLEILYTAQKHSRCLLQTFMTSIRELFISCLYIILRTTLRYKYERSTVYVRTLTYGTLRMTLDCDTYLSVNEPSKLRLARSADAGMAVCQCQGVHGVHDPRTSLTARGAGALARTYPVGMPIIQSNKRFLFLALLLSAFTVSI